MFSKPQNLAVWLWGNVISVIKWAALLFLSLYTLAIIVALFDILSFHRLLNHQVDGKPLLQRNALMTLRDMQKSIDAQQGTVNVQQKSTVNFGLLALKLDELHAHRDALSKANGLEAQDTSLQGLLTQVQEASKTLDAASKNAAAKIGFSETTGKTTCTGAVPAVTDDGTLDECHKAAEEYDEVSKRLQQRTHSQFNSARRALRQISTQLDQELGKSAGYAIANYRLDLQAMVEELRTVNFQLSAPGTPMTPQADSTLLSTSKLSEQDNLASTLETEALIKEISTVLTQLAHIVKTQEKADASVVDNIAGLYNKLNTYVLDDEITYHTEPPTDSPNTIASDAVLNSIASQLAALEKSLLHQADFRDAIVIAPAVSKLRSASEWFQNANTDNLTMNIDGSDIEGPAALSEFKRIVAGMSSTLDELTANMTNTDPTIKLRSELASIPNAGPVATMLVREFSRLGSYRKVMWFNTPAMAPSFVPDQLGIDPLSIATMGSSPLTMILVFVVGAFGSLVYIAKKQLQFSLNNNNNLAESYPLRWYIMRPLFGMVVALAVFMLYKAGEIALGSGTDIGVIDEVNIWILCTLALFAGLLSWQAIQMIETRGSTWMRSQERIPLWATGLASTLRQENYEFKHCADHVGVSEIQVERWIEGQDKVTPEMQDRLVTWLERERRQIFNDTPPRNIASQHPLFATGLKDAISRQGYQIDAHGLAEMLGVEPARVEKWLNQRMRVSPAMQWRLADLLEISHHKLFGEETHVEEAFGVQLRLQMYDRHIDSITLAKRLGIDQQTVWDWMDLVTTVDDDKQIAIARVLNVSSKLLFAAERPAGDKITRAMFKEKLLNGTSENNEQTAIDGFAQIHDIDPVRLSRWVTQQERVPHPTQLILSRELQESPEDLFKMAA